MYHREVDKFYATFQIVFAVLYQAMQRDWLMDTYSY